MIHFFITISIPNALICTYELFFFKIGKSNLVIKYKNNKVMKIEIEEMISVKKFIWVSPIDKIFKPKNLLAFFSFNVPREDQKRF